MMLHRHFEEQGKNKNLTTLADVTPTEKPFVSEVFPPDDEAEKTEVSVKRRGRAKKED